MYSSSITSDTSKHSPYLNYPLRRRQQKKMSITQTYYLAHTARKKLIREASRADHDLRLLVGHANLLDSLMYNLADTEREQERRFISGVTKVSAYSSHQHIQWTSTVVKGPGEDWDAEDASDLDSELSDSDSDDSDYDESEFVINTPPTRRRAPSPAANSQEDLLEDDGDTNSDFEYHNAGDLDEVRLTRSPSRKSPPELLIDSDGESEDEATPLSLPQHTLEVIDEKELDTTVL